MFLTFPVGSTSWYKPGQTPGSVLGEVSSSMEECRAETVALYCESNSEWGLCANKGVALIVSGQQSRYPQDLQCECYVVICLSFCAFTDAFI
jgi:hypothetical protein